MITGTESTAPVRAGRPAESPDSPPAGPAPAERPLLVVKFGGSSFVDLGDYREVADYLGRLSETHRVVAVVSGMSGTTGRLLEAARTIDPDLHAEVQDQVLATAEMVSAGFLRAALQAGGYSALDLWASQIGIVSDDRATRAKIRSIDTRPVLDALAGHQVVVVAGGQAVRADGRITMLGRNSSDLTAVALAAALGAGHCEIFSDVPGVYTADPYVVPEALLLPRLTYDQCAQMSASGAKVLHGGSVAVGREHGVTIVCRALDGRGSGEPLTASTGTVVGGGPHGTAVVGERGAQLHRFDGLRGWAETGRSALDSALAALAEEAFDVVAVPSGGDTVLVFTGAQVGVAAVLEQLGIKTEPVSGLGLVSVVEADGRTERRLLPVAELDDEVRRLHIEAHGAGAAEGERFRGSKRRSDHSSLLSSTPTVTAGAC
ncbi:hypothetical protein [Streptomyces sp. NPDC089919]|uniref:amino acid kinase family protein n=1 Tax=Streptomyces sp. NPDC089919 TaxID=3155188 RepID=UPI003417D38D